MDNEAAILDKMIYTLLKADSVYKPSLFWQNINNVHMNQLSKEGYENFKQTLNLKYFNFIVSVLNEQFVWLIKWWLNYPSPEFEVFKAKVNSYRACKDNNIITKLTGKIAYPVFVAMLYEYTKSVDKLDLLERIFEPIQGNPISVWYKHKAISQDLCNSILEFYSIKEGLSFVNELNICELGAGYGRLGYVFLKDRECKLIKYTVVDIPPALYIAQRYLSEVFPDSKVFKFREFKDYGEIKDEWEKSQIRFLEPQQIRLLPAPQFNLFVNVSSLHEMTMQQIQNYFDIIGEYTQGYFYTKQWLKSINRADKIVVNYSNYPIPDGWKELYFRKCKVQSLFFEQMYKIGVK
jgi:putative sugar O-methyltransferase